MSITGIIQPETLEKALRHDVSVWERQKENKGTATNDELLVTSELSIISTFVNQAHNTVA